MTRSRSNGAGEDSLSEALRRAAELLYSTKTGEVAEHVAEETLAAYLSQSLAAEDEEAIREHLSGCTYCAALVLEMDEFAATAPRSTVRQRSVRPEGARPWTRSLTTWRGQLKWLTSRAVAWSVAAATMLALLTLGSVMWFERPVAVDGWEQANGFVVALRPASRSRTDVGAPQQFAVPETAESVVLVVTTYEPLPFPSLEMVILSAAGDELASRSGLENISPVPDFYQYSAVFSAERLVPGVRKVLLVGNEGGERQVLSATLVEFSRAATRVSP